MKKTLLAIILVFLITVSCKQNDTVEITKDEYKMLKGDTIRPKYPKPFKLYIEGLNYGDEGIVSASDGHEYLITDYQCDGMTVTHYIDCEKCALKAAEEAEKPKVARSIIYKDATN